MKIIKRSVSDSTNKLKSTYVCDSCGYECELLDSEYDGCCPNCHEHHGEFGKVESCSNRRQVTSAMIGRPEQYSDYIEPNEPKPDYVDDDTTIEFNVKDIVIEVRDDTLWYYEDEEYKWAENPDDSKGIWYSDSHGIQLDDTSGIVEKVDDLLLPNIPTDVGKYKISFSVKLSYDVYGIESYKEWFQDNKGNGDYDEEIYSDNAEVEYVEKASSISDFTFERI